MLFDRMLLGGEGGFVSVREHIETETLAIEHRVSRRDIRLEGFVRETLTVDMLTPAFAKLQREYPGIVVEILAAARSVSLTRREAAIALRLVRLTQNEVAARLAPDGV